MKEIVKLNLENEQDLILVHRRTMKLAEMLGLSLSVQTIFATAVSEIARSAIECRSDAYLRLGIEFLRGNQKRLKAIVSDTVRFCEEKSESVSYARRLVDDVEVSTTAEGTQVLLSHRIPFPGTVSEARIQSFIEYFQGEPPLSAYDELKRKNFQLQELAARLHESENNYRQLTDSLPLMMFSIDQSTRVLYSNRWFREFIGFTLDHLQANQCRPYVHADDYEKIFNAWNRSKEEKKPLHGQIRLKQKTTGAFVWHMISILPIENEAQQVDRWMGFIVDIHAQKLVEQTLKDNSELRATQEQLQQYQAELEEKIRELNRSNHDLEQFAYIASHDLQEPLRKIQVYSELVQRSLETEPSIKKYFEKINSSAERMGDLIKDVLYYSRLSTAERRFEPVDLNTIVESVKVDLEVMIGQKSARIDYQSLPVIQGIPSQLSQLFLNLIGNSLKFSVRQPVISITWQELDAGEIRRTPQLRSFDRAIELRITDNGIGFKQEYAEQIFNIFQRLNHKRSFQGTGVGLALCKKIVENHHGLITAEGTPDEGATFIVRLPLQPEAEPAS